MTNIENIFVCLTAPMMVGAFLAGRNHRKVFLLLASGYLVCIFSAYINTFFTGIYHADLAAATVEITPVVEEIMKLLPLLFYLLVFEPKPRDAFFAILIINAGFATFENACYLIENGASQFTFLLMRGLGTGTMHVVCGAIIGYGLLFVWQRPWLKLAGTLGLLCAAITYHAVYNMFVGEGGILQMIGFAFPMLTAFIGVAVEKLRNPLDGFG